MRCLVIFRLAGVAVVPSAAAILTPQSTTHSKGYLADPGLSAAQNFSGVWQLETYSPKLLPVDGGPLPFTPEGKQLFEKNARELKRADAAHRRCVPLGTPRAFVSPYPFLLIQSSEALLP